MSMYYALYIHDMKINEKMKKLCTTIHTGPLSCSHDSLLSLRHTPDSAVRRMC